MNSKQKVRRASEEWHSIDGTDGIYEVSNFGRVRRMRGYGISKRAKVWPIRIIRGSLDTKGYPQVCLSVKDISMTKKIHPLVAKCFIGKRPEGFQVNHKDGNKRNNHVSNLEYVTPRQNSIHAIKIGLYDPRQPRPSTSKKICPASVLLIRQLAASGFSRVSLAKRFNIHVMTIGEIVRKEIWKRL